MNILSYGGGVNTGALLALAAQGELDLDYIIFADTGGELPETYQWIEEIAKPTSQEIGAEFVTVTGKHRTYYTLYAYLWHYRMTPSRTVRSCTDRYKVQPIHKWIIETAGTEDPHISSGRDGPYLLNLGAFSAPLPG